MKVTKELDAGDIYLKKDLSLEGTAREIYARCSQIIQTMIEEIIVDEISPEPQEGEPTFFKRRKPEEGDISELKTVESVYDYIRMLDADTYPNAFLETSEHKYEFTNAHLQDGIIKANVRIFKK